VERLVCSNFNPCTEPRTLLKLNGGYSKIQSLFNDLIPCNFRTKELETNAAAIEKTIKEVLDKRAAKEKELLKVQVGVTHHFKF